MTAPTVLVAAGVIWRPDGRLLLTQRPSGGHLAGLWEFPGGKVEAQEDPKDTVVRECAEECELGVRVLDIVDATFHQYPNKSVLLLFYDAALTPFTNVDPVVQREVADHRWLLPSELGDFPLPPPDAPLVQKLQARGLPQVLRQAAS